MNPKWLPISQAAELLTKRGIDPLEALTAIVRETGEFGLNRCWGLANRVTIRGRSGMDWLMVPDIDVVAATISVPSYENGRRFPVMAAVPLLVASSEIDRRWPEAVAPLAQKTTTVQREERAALAHFLDTIIARTPSERISV